MGCITFTGSFLNLPNFIFIIKILRLFKNYEFFTVNLPPNFHSHLSILINHSNNLQQTLLISHYKRNFNFPQCFNYRKNMVEISLMNIYKHVSQINLFGFYAFN